MIEQKKGKLTAKGKTADTNRTGKVANSRLQRDRAFAAGRGPPSEKRLRVMKSDLPQGSPEMAEIAENNEPAQGHAQLPALQDRQLSVESGSSLDRVARGGAKPPPPWSIGSLNTKNQKLKRLELAKNRGASMKQLDDIRQLDVVKPIPEDDDWRLPKIESSPRPKAQNISG